MDKLFRDILARADAPGEAVFTADEVADWPKGAFKQLLALGLLKDTAPAQTVQCIECDDGCWIEPEIRPGTGKGRAVGTYFCKRNDDNNGLKKVDLGRKLRWEFCFKGLAGMITKAVKVWGTAVELEPGRLVALGNVSIDGKKRELFLARGINWDDAKLFSRAARLRGALHPAVLTLTGMPAGDVFPGRQLAVRPIVEISTFDGKALHLSLDGAFPDAQPSPWSSIPDEPITLDRFMLLYCEKLSEVSRRIRRHGLLGAARNGTVKMPRLARRFKGGGTKYYFTHDLFRAWQGFIDEGVDLPSMLPEYSVVIAPR